jgi:hypothetical protein
MLCASVGVCTGAIMTPGSGPLGIAVMVASIAAAPIVGGWCASIPISTDHSDDLFRIGLGTAIGFLVGVGAMSASLLGAATLNSRLASPTTGQSNLDVWLVTSMGVGSLVLPIAGATAGAMVAQTTLDQDQATAAW